MRPKGWTLETRIYFVSSGPPWYLLLVYLKSPQNKTVIPPMVRSLWWMSLHILSPASTALRCAIVHSSHTIKWQSRRTFALSLFRENYKQVVLLIPIVREFYTSCVQFNHAPGKSVVAIPEDATASAILSLCRNCVDKVCEKSFPNPARCIQENHFTIIIIGTVANTMENTSLFVR